MVKCETIRFTPEYCKSVGWGNIGIGVYTAKEFEEKMGGGCVDEKIYIEVANDVEGKYECVCEHGIEVTY